MMSIQGFRLSTLAFSTLGALLLFACSGPTEEIAPLGSGIEQQSAELSWDLGPPPSSPIIPSSLHDQSRDLAEILEHGTLTKQDCDKYFAGQKDRETTLRCGKWMFFYGHVDMPGSPKELVDLLRNNAPSSIGKSLERIGLFADPFSSDALPVGLSKGPDMPGGVHTYTLTCGSCHFGKTTDGRYVVGSPNHAFEFGKFTLSVSTLPELVFQPDKKYAPQIESILGPVRDEVFRNPLNRLRVVGEAIRLLPNLIHTGAQAPNDEAKLALAISPSGVMDPYAPPAVDDRVKIPVRMSPLWGIDPVAMTAAGSTHGAMLGSNGGAPELKYILRTFAYISGKVRNLPLGPNYKVENVQPLIDYIMSLNPPRPEKILETEKVRAGQVLFHDKCFSCHNGPGYAGTRVFDPVEIGVDANIIHLADPDNTGKPLYDVLTPGELTKGLRTRRLSAVWSMTRLFHNGSVNSLADLFCLNGPRPESTLGSGHSNAGHAYTCDGLSTEEKQLLITFLESL